MLEGWLAEVVAAIVAFLLDGIFAQIGGFFADLFGNPGIDTGE